MGAGLGVVGVCTAGATGAGVGVGAKENVGMEGGGEGAGVGAKVTFLSKKLGCLAGDWAGGGVGA